MTSFKNVSELPRSIRGGLSVLFTFVDGDPRLCLLFFPRFFSALDTKRIVLRIETKGVVTL